MFRASWKFITCLWNLAFGDPVDRRLAQAQFRYGPYERWRAFFRTSTFGWFGSPKPWPHGIKLVPETEEHERRVKLVRALMQIRDTGLYNYEALIWMCRQDSENAYNDLRKEAAEHIEERKELEPKLKSELDDIRGEQARIEREIENLEALSEDVAGTDRESKLRNLKSKYNRLEDRAEIIEDRLSKFEKSEDEVFKQLWRRSEEMRRLKSWWLPWSLKSLVRTFTSPKKVYKRRPRYEVFSLLSYYVESTGFVDYPVPIKRMVEADKVTRNIVYNAGGKGHLVYHAMRAALGQEDYLKDEEEKARLAKEAQRQDRLKARSRMALEGHSGDLAVRNDIDSPEVSAKDDELPANVLNDRLPFEGAVYQSFHYESPYFKRGVFVIRNGERRGPVEVEYYDCWRSEREVAAEYSGQGSGENRCFRSYEEYYRGYLLDQGFDSYVMLFGPHEPNTPPVDGKEALRVFRGLQYLCDPEKLGDRAADLDWTPQENRLNPNKESMQAFLKRQLKDHPDLVHAIMVKTVVEFKKVDAEAEQAGSDGLNPMSGGQPGGAKDPFGMKMQSPGQQLAPIAMRGGAGGIFSDLMSGAPKPVNPNPREPDLDDLAKNLRVFIWEMMGLVSRDTKEGRRKSLRLRTVYLEGANRHALTPNILRGSVIAHDNSAKSDMLMERTIMQRISDPSDDDWEIARVTMFARLRSDRFDMRSSNARQLADFEPNYRQIFLALGYDITRPDDEKAYRVNPVNRETTESDEDDLEIELG